MNYTILELATSEIEVEKSHFIGYLFPVSSIDEFNEFLSKIKKENMKARHFCYAYIINDEKRGNDDGEPKGSAGLPLLNSLIKNELSNVAIIVIRYFGGTLLGSGRLLRTYVRSFEETFLKAKKVELISMKKYEVSLSYDLYDIFKNYLKMSNFNILNTTFNDTIIISFIAPVSFKKETMLDKFLFKIKILNEEDYCYRKEI